ncbi:MAG: hypothetical protein NT004_07550 [Bacteroidetes bacterium]|nr:hypothetical protein [Bacteroidota bacterium]
MKNYLLFCVILFLATVVMAQDPGLEAPAKQRRFHVGVSYSFYKTSLKVTSFSAHSIWYGSDLGTFTASDEEIAQMNDIETNISKQNVLVIEAGAILVNQLKGHWFIDASLLLGVSATKTQTDLDLPNLNQMTVKSNLANPAVGLSFNFRYNFNPRWGITAVPEIFYAWGKADNITDSINPMTANFVNDLHLDYSNGYGRIALMASFTVKRLTISAGPGFYYSQVRKTYEIRRTNPENGYEYFDELKTSLRSESFVDGCLKADWTFIDPLTLSLQVAAGKDIYVTTGLRFNF